MKNKIERLKNTNYGELPDIVGDIKMSLVIEKIYIDIIKNRDKINELIDVHNKEEENGDIIQTDTIYCVKCGKITEPENYKGYKFCKECGDISTRELCLAPSCERYNKQKGKICVEQKEPQPQKCDHKPNNPNNWEGRNWDNVPFCKKCGILKSELDQPKKWKPTQNTQFYWINSKGKIGTGLWQAGKKNQSRYSFGNCFKTREQAERARNSIKNLLRNI